jgi:hypothetical protein
VPTSGDFTTTTSCITMKRMASHQASSSTLRKLVLPITRGSSFKPSNKKQKKETKKGYNMWVSKDPTSRPRGLISLSHFLKKIFASRVIHTKTPMVISCVIKGFVIHNVLVNTNSVVDIIFAKFFKQEPEDKLDARFNLSSLWLQKTASDDT